MQEFFLDLHLSLHDQAKGLSIDIAAVDSPRKVLAVKTIRLVVAASLPQAWRVVKIDGDLALGPNHLVLRQTPVLVSKK